MYKFDVPLANHGGQVGTYRVRVNVSNVVAESSCEASFELRPLATPVVILTPLIGSGATPNMFVVGQSAAQAILSASITRTENMAMTVQLLDSQSNAAASASLGAGAGSVNLGGARWTGDAWSMRPYTRTSPQSERLCVAAFSRGWFPSKSRICTGFQVWDRWIQK